VNNPQKWSVDTANFISKKEKGRRVLGKFIGKKHVESTGKKASAYKFRGPAEYIDDRAFASARKSVHLANFVQQSPRRRTDSSSNGLKENPSLSPIKRNSSIR
jgi:hypothetical protein